MEKLNLPDIPARIRDGSGHTEIYDPVRRKWVYLSAEEWVRQHFVQYLVIEKKIPLSLLAVEKTIVLNRMKKRCDIVIYGTSGNPLMVVECKSPKIVVSQDAFDQVARYNMTLKVRYVVVTNGTEHYCCRIDFRRSAYAYLDEIPDFDQLSNEE